MSTPDDDSSPPSPGDPPDPPADGAPPHGGPPQDDDGPVPIDLALIHLPIEDEPANAQVALSSRYWPKEDGARAFWGYMSAHVDLTGRGSLVRKKPPGLFDRSPTERFERGLAYMEKRIAEREQANVLLDEAKVRPSNLHRNVAPVIKEVTPQFFLRNIARVEREVNVRRLAIRYAVWRQEPDPETEALGMPELGPKAYIEEFSFQSMPRLQRERRDNVHGFAWEEKIQGRIFIPTRTGPFTSGGPDRIPVGELSLKPAPPNRLDSAQKTAQTLKRLGARFDATKDEGESRPREY